MFPGFDDVEVLRDRGVKIPELSWLLYLLRILLTSGIHAGGFMTSIACLPPKQDTVFINVRQIVVTILPLSGY